MLNQSNQVVVSILSAAVIILAAVSSSQVGYVAYASEEISNCPKNNSVNRATVQSASQVAIGNNIQQIIIQNGDQKGIAGNTNNNNCKHNHNGGGSSYGHHNSINRSNNAPTNDNNNNQYLVQNAVGNNNNQYSVQNSNQASFSGNLNQWIYHLKEKILSHMFDSMN